ncbi:MAG: hypothetical protein WDN45_16940 [Caulobacteraceae bacterium]
MFGGEGSALVHHRRAPALRGGPGAGPDGQPAAAGPRGRRPDPHPRAAPAPWPRPSSPYRAAGPCCCPRLRALGDLDEGEPPFEPGVLALDLPPAVSAYRRRFELARLVSRTPTCSSGRSTAAGALELADALAAFLDSLQIEEAAGDRAGSTPWWRATWPGTGKGPRNS